MKTKLLSLLVLGLALPLAGCNDKKKDEPEIVRPVLSVVVQPRSDSEQGFVGSIEPRISAPLSFRLLGRLIARNVNVSSVVTKGTTIASLDPTTLQLQVQAARADLSSAEAQFSNAAGNEERQRTLLQSKNTPQSTYDAALQVRDSARAGVEQAQAAVAKAEEQLTYSQLFSDFDGVVTSVGAEVGQVVSAGQMVVTVARSDQRPGRFGGPNGGDGGTLRPADRRGRYSRPADERPDDGHRVQRRAAIGPNSPSGWLCL